ncbi:MAG: polysaccharide deacetylase family protein [Bacteroidales bacterium]|nr:polysaccharide deacetylase family protein [Bacteroidales bacterium]HPY83340.1 polysaccharide deacetylase family protein [Bacteroidales bacterium]
MKQPLLNIFRPQPPVVAEMLWPNVIWHLPQAEKTAYITFDDGPTPIYTEKILKCLDEFNVPASFFCVGKNVASYPDIFSEISKRGHLIGSHTYNHYKGWFCSNEKYYENVHKGANIVSSKYFRPPYGKIKFSQARYLSELYTIVMWDVLSRDYDERISGQECFLNVKNYVNNGSIIVFHDSKKASKNLEYALPKTIEYLLQHNYSLQSLDASLVKTIPCIV